MPYTFNVTGWEDFDGNRQRGAPSDLDKTHGVFVEVTNPEDPEDQHAFWAWGLGTFRTWAEWWVYIGALMASHGMDLEDSGPDDEPPGEPPPPPPRRPPPPPPPSPPPRRPRRRGGRKVLQVLRRRLFGRGR